MPMELYGAHLCLNFYFFWMIINAYPMKSYK